MIFEQITEEVLNEKLITYGNRAPYGQVVFVAGGAGSGKGFAIKNFMDSSSFRIRDVDEMKKQIQVLDKLRRLSIDKIVDKYGRNMKQKDIDLVRKIQADGYELKNMDLKNPDHVYALHMLVKATGVKEAWLGNILIGNSNPKTLPNIMFDMTLKEVSDVTKVLPDLVEAGYDPKNIHLTWVLTNYRLAMKQNKERDRRVPEDILLQTHEGAANTVWGLVTKALPRGMKGRVDVILNNREHTVFFTDEDGRKIKTRPRTDDPDIKKLYRGSGGEPATVIGGFLSLPVKKQGGGFYPESSWKKKLYIWIKKNAPESLTYNMEESVSLDEVNFKDLFKKGMKIFGGGQSVSLKDISKVPDSVYKELVSISQNFGGNLAAIGVDGNTVKFAIDPFRGSGLKNYTYNLKTGKVSVG